MKDNKKTSKKLGYMKSRKPSPMPIRDHEINISVNEKEKADITAIANEMSMKVSELCYRIVLGKTIRKYDPTYANVLRLLSNEANNLSQIQERSIFLGFTEDNDTMLYGIVEKLGMIIKSYQPSQFNKTSRRIRKFHAVDAKKRGRNRNIRLGISFSEDELSKIQKRAEALKDKKGKALKPAEYCYLMIFGKTFEVIIPSKKEELQLIADHSEAINDLARTVNTFSRLTKEEIGHLFDILNKIEMTITKKELI